MFDGPLVREAEVLQLLGIKSRETLLKWEAKKLFPRRRRIGPRSFAWLQSDVDAWLATLKDRGTELPKTTPCPLQSEASAAEPAKQPPALEPAAPKKKRGRPEEDR